MAEAVRSALAHCSRLGVAREVLSGLSEKDAAALLADWPIWARGEQMPPEEDWTTWVMLGGRGAGKTRAGAEWVRGVALGLAPYADLPAGRIALVGETYNDAREVMVEGISGILAVSAPWERPLWQPSRRRLEWPNGAVAQLFSANDPESLRGPQFHAAWSDELAKWTEGEATWDMLQFALRLGSAPRQVVTTTPRAVPLLKRLLADERTVVTRMSTAQNAANLAPAFLSSVVGRYDGTRLGRQELNGELIEDAEGALWSREALDNARLRSAPEMTRIVVAVDPPATSGAKADACGIVAAGVTADGVGCVLADRSVRGAIPQEWAARAVLLFHAVEADKLVAEVNQGGEMVANVIAQADATVPVTMVRASRGKWVRAEPVAMLYAQGRVRHVGTHSELEDEMCNFTAGGTAEGRSPDRLDALVWALTELMLRGSTTPPRVRRF